MADIKILRERLGAGMMDSKKALVEAEGDIERAIEILRLKGLKGVAKREGRATGEGLIAAHSGSGEAILLELACETDFVAKNEKFLNLSEQVLAAAVAVKADSVRAALDAPGPQPTASVENTINDVAAILGEKVVLRRLRRLIGENFSVYLHRTNADLPPQVGVIVAYRGENAEVARSIAQHIAFADPQYLRVEDIPAELIERERNLVTEISKGEGKPEVALPKIIEGRLQVFRKQMSLLEQDYARDNKLTVKRVAAEAGIRITDFVRFRVGSGRESE